MASNLTDQVRSISEVTKAVALGDLGKLVNVDVQGEMLDLKVGVFLMMMMILLRFESLIDDRKLDGGPVEHSG